MKNILIATVVESDSQFKGEDAVRRLSQALRRGYLKRTSVAVGNRIVVSCAVWRNKRV